MNAIVRNVMIGGGIVAGAAGLIALGMRNGDKRAERMNVTETPFDTMKMYPTFDANADGLIDRKTETVTFTERGLKSGPYYHSIRAVADAADMIAGNRDGFASDSELQDLARTYTAREGAKGLTGREASVFHEDYGLRVGDGGTFDEMTGNSYI